MSENDFFLKIASLLSDPTSVIIVMLLQTCQGDITPEFLQSTGHPPIERTFFLITCVCSAAPRFANSFAIC